MKKHLGVLIVLVLLGLALTATALAQEPVQCSTTYTVQKQDTLSKIADKYLGSPYAYPQILDANNVDAGDIYDDIDNPDLIIPGWTLCIPGIAAPEGLSREELANAEVKTEWTESGTAQLTDGEFSEPAVPGSASMTTIMLTDWIAYGELNGQPVAAVVIVSSGGGTGNFYELAIFVNKNGKPYHVSSAPLGDRAEINSVTVENDQVVVDMVTQGPDDPMCCPTQQVVKTFALEGEQLKETSSEVVGTVGSGTDQTTVTEIMWNWEKFNDTVGQNDIIVSYPPSYQLWLGTDGMFWARADCNSLQGGYTMEGSSLALEPGPMTMAMCPPESLSDQYIALLGQVATYLREGDNLHLNLKMDSGDMVFAKLHAVTGKIVVEGDAVLPEGAMLEVRVDDVSKADAPAERVGGVMKAVTQFPIEFEAPYNPAVIGEKYTYALNVKVTDADGKLLYTNTQAYNVLTRGFPNYNVEVMVEKVN